MSDHDALADSPTAASRPCAQCGARLEYHPGQGRLTCPYCSHQQDVQPTAGRVQERDYLAALREATSAAAGPAQRMLACGACGARVTPDPDVQADACPYCGSHLDGGGTEERPIRPESLLPFQIEAADARRRYQDWVRGRWFAPNDFRAFVLGREKSLQGIYVPFWTYDGVATTRYTGERGEHYYDTEHYTTTENGKTVHKTRRVRRTRWYPASGTVVDRFDDILILGSRNLPKDKADALEPWDLENLEAYAPEYLAGYRTELYGVDVEQGFAEAQEVADSTIRRSIRCDIGGDEQRIHSVDSRWSDVTFKHLLLPVWMSSYPYREKIYRFLVNGRTGEVQGERPWSWVKITLAVLGVASIIAAIVLATHG